MTSLSRALTAAIVAIAAFMVGRQVGGRFTRDAPVVRPPVAAVDSSSRQLVFVYIGSSTCGPSNTEGLPDQVSRLREMVATKADAQSAGFQSVGVARERNPTSGMSHLARIGSWDEITVGLREFNSGSLRYISRDHPGLPATPQIVVVERIVKRLGVGWDPSDFSERVLVRKVGTLEIQRWLEMGAPLPRTDTLSVSGEAASVVPMPYQ